MIGEQVHPITAVTQSVKGRGSKAGNLVYRDMMDEEGRVIGVRIDSNDDSGFWLEISYLKTSQSDDTKEDEKNDDDNIKGRGSNAAMKQEPMSPEKRARIEAKKKMGDNKTVEDNDRFYGITGGAGHGHGGPGF